MRQRRLAALAAITLAFMELSLATGCATTSKPSKKEHAARKASDKGDKNFTLHSSRSDVDWRWVRRGRKAMGGPALDSY